MEQLQSTSLDEFPTVKKVISQVRSTSDGMTYQGTPILHYDKGIWLIKGGKNRLLMLHYGSLVIDLLFL